MSKRGKFYLRSQHFSIKPGETVQQRHEIALGVNATAATLKFAIARAREIDAQLVWGKFDWKPVAQGEAQVSRDGRGMGGARYEVAHWEATQRTASKDSIFH